VECREFDIPGERRDFLMVDWLTELLYVFDTERLLSGKVEVKVDHRGLHARVTHHALDAADYKLLREVKAITYHGLKVERAADGWLAEVIVDI
jgi:SHS2 domain-containing protein